MSGLPPRPGDLPRLDFAIPCKHFDNDAVTPSIEEIIEAVQPRRPGRFAFTLAVKLFARPGQHRLAVTPVSPKGELQSQDGSAVDFTIEEPAWGERMAVSISFPCDTVGWWRLDLKLDDKPLGETHLWVEFPEE